MVPVSAQMSFTSNMQKTLFAIGFGYVAEHLAGLLHLEGWRVIGTTRNADKAKSMRNAGFEPVLGDEATRFVPPEEAFWLVSTPTRGGRCPGHELFAQHAASAAWIGYISATSVYGDRQGGWVLENTPVSPDSPRGHDRVRAENAWRESFPASDIIRLPGIYGPGRSPFEALEVGEARRIDKPGQVFSRIHVEDIASGLKAAMDRPGGGRVLNLCDDWPSAPGDPIAFAAELIGTAPPPLVAFDEAEMSDMARSFYSECKRVGNGMTKAALGWKPRYPGYREGLTAIFGKRG